MGTHSGAYELNHEHAIIFNMYCP